MGSALEEGTFTSVGTINQRDTEELVIANADKTGSSFDWENLLEVGDYIEIAENTGKDTVIYEVVADPIRNSNEERIRVKFIRETGDGDGNFNLQSNCEFVFSKKT